jgi:hypothetical protein
MDGIPIIGGLIDTLNWLTITTPFIAGFAAYNWGRQTGEGKAIPAVVGVLSFCGLVAIWYVLYQFLEFPFWMRWFN